MALKNQQGSSRALGSWDAIAPADRLFKALVFAGMVSPVHAVVVDGQFSDWTAAQRVGTDPALDVGAGQVDWRTLWATYQDGALYLSYQTSATIDFPGSAWQYGIYLDTDNRVGTGYRGPDGRFLLGADYLLEGATLYRYTGSGRDWAWSFAGTATYGIGGDRLELRIAGKLLGLTRSSKIRVLLAANGAESPDYAPNDRSGFAYPAERIVLDGGFADWSKVPVLGSDSAGDAAAGDPVDWTRLRALAADGTLFLNYETVGAVDLANHVWRYDILLDTDRNTRSGYIGVAGSPGAEFMIEGATLFRYQGQGDDWNWAPLARLAYAAAGNRMELAVAEQHLGLPANYAIRVSLFGNNPTVADVAPNEKPGFAFTKNLLTSVGCQSLAIPSYFYPGPLWDQIYAASPRSGFVILNPYNGPGALPDPNYTQAVAAAHAHGIKVLGYVSTGYSGRPLADVKNDINLFKAWYDIDGIFLDETSIYAVALPYYREIDSYLRKMYPGTLTVLNNGKYPDEAYMALGDLLVSFEGTYAEYMALAPPAWVYSYPSSRFWQIVWQTPASQMSTVIATTRARNAGYVFVTDDELPNPYDSLPSYWFSELSLLNQKCP